MASGLLSVHAACLLPTTISPDKRVLTEQEVPKIRSVKKQLTKTCHSLIHPFAHPPFIHSFVRSFVPSFIHSFVPFVPYIRSIHSFHSFVPFIRSIHSFHSFVPFIRSIHSFHSFVPFIPSIHSFHSFIHSCIYSCMHAFIHSVMHSFHSIPSPSLPFPSIHSFKAYNCIYIYMDTYYIVKTSFRYLIARTHNAAQSLQCSIWKVLLHLHCLQLAPL